MNVTIHLVAKILDNGKPCLYMDYMKLCTDIHSLWRMKLNYFGDPMTFSGSPKF